MIDKARLDKGLYWQQAWKLVEGCTKVSPGCDNCWSETETAMHCGHPNEKISSRACLVIDPLTNRFDDIHLRQDNLDLPLRTKKPTVFAVWNDLFHEGVSDEFRDKAYAVMALCQQHTFLVLTKRAHRLAKYWSADRVEFGVRLWNSSPCLNGGKRLSAIICANIKTYGLPNVWHGVTAENQEQADLRIPHLLKVPGKRFLSIEPMLDPVDINASMSCTPNDNWCEWCGGFRDSSHDCYEPGFGVDVVLLGGESGEKARPMHPDWVRSIREQCDNANAVFYFKQWGEWHPNCTCNTKSSHKEIYRPVPGKPGCMFRCGKKAGRTLDGKLHNDLPWLVGE